MLEEEKNCNHYPIKLPVMKTMLPSFRQKKNVKSLTSKVMMINALI
jgi:hypothetical protein